MGIIWPKFLPDHNNKDINTEINQMIDHVHQGGYELIWNQTQCMVAGVPMQLPVRIATPISVGAESLVTRAKDSGSAMSEAWEYVDRSNQPCSSAVVSVYRLSRIIDRHKVPG